MQEDKLADDGSPGQLHKVKLVNFMCHEHFEMDFWSVFLSLTGDAVACCSTSTAFAVDSRGKQHVLACQACHVVLASDLHDGHQQPCRCMWSTQTAV